MLIVAGNFGREGNATARLRVPPELADLCALPDDLTVRLRLDRRGAQDQVVTRLTRRQLIDQGFSAALPPQSSHVYLLERSP